jgi:hypothetical protein
VKKNHPIARGFDGCWPIKDMLMVHLKNTSEAARNRKVLCDSCISEKQTNKDTAQKQKPGVVEAKE